MTAIPTILLSGPKRVDILTYRGDSGRFRITLTNDVGSPIDLTSMTWDSDIRENVNDPLPLATFDVQPVVGEDNSVDVVLTADQADLLIRKCFYDVQMNDGTNVVTLVYGSIKVTEDVSRP